MAGIEYNANGDAVSFVGEEAVAVFQMATLATGLRMFARTGMRPNRMWTPKAMMQTAASLTGKKFKARDYEGAAVALLERVQAEKARLAAQ